MEEIQGLADQQLQEADEEKETLLAQLEDLEKRVGMSKDESVHCDVLMRRFKKFWITLLSKMKYRKEHRG